MMIIDFFFCTFLLILVAPDIPFYELKMKFIYCAILFCDNHAIQSRLRGSHAACEARLKQNLQVLDYNISHAPLHILLM